jgi:hypothetical protein
MKAKKSKPRYIKFTQSFVADTRTCELSHFTMKSCGPCNAKGETYYTPLLDMLEARKRRKK